MGQESDAHLEEVRQRIEQWKSTRTQRSLIPAELWDEAIALARVVGVSQVSRALGIGYESLRKRGTEPSTSIGSPLGCSEKFVELSGAELLAPSLSQVPAVEIVESSGARLTIRVADPNKLDLAMLVRAFRELRP